MSPVASSPATGVAPVSAPPPPPPTMIGVFDSGLGGLSVLREIAALRPELPTLYVADQAHCPYGERPAAAIIARAQAITERLLADGAQRIVIACNTATIAAVETLRATYPVPFVGMEPAIKPAVAATRTGVVGVLATGAALAGDKLHRLIDRHRGDVRIITQPCPGLVEQVEAGDLDGPVTRQLLARYAEPLVAAGADVLVLGCTHYPFLRPTLAALVGPQVLLIDTGAAVARRVDSLLPPASGPPSAADIVTRRWYTSGPTAAMAAIGGRLWGAPIAAEALAV